MSEESDERASSRDAGARNAAIKNARDTPGRPERGGSRQQTHREQVSQSGDADVDRRHRNDPTPEEVAAGAKYRDRPADEGKHGDGRQEPNAGGPTRKDERVK
jgi:hypothetical protein